MATSLESRAPFLDHRIVEFAARLSLDFLADRHSSKKILRSVLYRHVTQTIVDRPKAGFSVPMAGWLRGELREWAVSLLHGPPELESELNLAECRSFLEAHIRGERDFTALLWPMLMFMAWRKEWM
jgi:asparagine synthase (glutamine-hydrolysing)